MQFKLFAQLFAQVCVVVDDQDRLRSRHAPTPCTTLPLTG
jgi:hypothetical protein